MRALQIHPCLRRGRGDLGIDQAALALVKGEYAGQTEVRIKLLYVLNYYRHCVLNFIHGAKFLFL